MGMIPNQKTGTLYWHVAKSCLTTGIGGPIGRWKMGLHIPISGVCAVSQSYGMWQVSVNYQVC
jgi:hypothetical protein